MVFAEEIIKLLYHAKIIGYKEFNKKNSIIKVL